MRMSLSPTSVILAFAQSAAHVRALVSQLPCHQIIDLRTAKRVRIEPGHKAPAGCRLIQMSASDTVAAEPSRAPMEQAVLVQYIVLRADLWKGLGWPLGSIIAQACHAATAALWLSRQEAVSQEYCKDDNLDHMHKVVLEVKGEAQLTKLAKDLEEAGVRHKLWVEQPENFPTCLATAPYRKDDVHLHFRKLKLCKGS